MTGRAGEEERRPEKGKEDRGDGKHVPATGETGGEAGREIRVSAETGDKPTDNPRRTQQVIQMVIGLSWSFRQWCRGSLISRPERSTQKEAFRIGSPAETWMAWRVSRGRLTRRTAAFAKTDFHVLESVGWLSCLNDRRAI